MKAQEYLELYCKRLEIETPPRMILILKEYRYWVREVLKHPKMPHIKNNLGRCWHLYNTIWVNAKKHRNKVELRHTIAHELVHIKYRGMPHGKRFDDLTMAVISDSLQAKPEPKQIPVLIPAIPAMPTSKCKLCGKPIKRLKAHLRRKHKKIKYVRFSAKTLSRYYFKNPAQDLGR